MKGPLSPGLRSLMEASMRAAAARARGPAVRTPKQARRDIWKKREITSMSREEVQEIMRVKMRVYSKRWRNEAQSAMRECWLYIKSEEAQRDNIIK